MITSLLPVRVSATPGCVVLEAPVSVPAVSKLAALPLNEYSQTRIPENPGEALFQVIEIEVTPDVELRQ